MPQAVIEHLILTAAMLILCFSFFWVSVTVMESLVFYGFQIKMTNVGNFLSYHVVSVVSLVNTSNVALTLNKTITIPATLDNNVVYGFKVVRSGGFSVIELYTVSTLYSYNIVIEVIRNSAGLTVVNLI